VIADSFSSAPGSLPAASSCQLPAASCQPTFKKLIARQQAPEWYPRTRATGGPGRSVDVDAFPTGDGSGESVGTHAAGPAELCKGNDRPDPSTFVSRTTDASAPASSANGGSLIRRVGVTPRSRAVRVCSSAEIQDSISSNHPIQGDGELVRSPGERAGSGFAYSRQHRGTRSSGNRVGREHVARARERHHLSTITRNHQHAEGCEPS